MVDEAIQHQRDRVQQIADADAALVAENAHDVAQRGVDDTARDFRRSRPEDLQEPVGARLDMTAQLGAAGQRVPDLGNGPPVAAQRHAICAQAAIDRNPDEAADLIAAGAATQHLAELDVAGLALEVEGQRRLAAVDHAREADRPAIEPSLETRDGEHAILQGRCHFRVAKRHRSAGEACHGDLQRAVDAAQRRSDRLRVEGGHVALRPRPGAPAAAQPAEIERAGPEIGGNDGLAA